MKPPDKNFIAFFGHVGHLNIIAFVYGPAFFESDSDGHRQIRGCRLRHKDFQVLRFSIHKPLSCIAVFSVILHP